MTRNFRTTLILIAGVVAFLLPTFAFAEEFNDPHWTESPINFSAGFKFGMAFPTDSIIKDVYGDKGVPYYSIEAGWKIVHELELHWEWAYWWDEGSGRTLGGDKVSEKYKLHLSPMELGLTYRFNFVQDQIIVPYIGCAGVGSYWMEERLDSSWKDRGIKWGVAGSGGLMVLLDGAQKRASGAMERDWKVNNTYFFYNFKYSYLNSFNDKGMDLTNTQHTLGVLFEF